MPDASLSSTVPFFVTQRQRETECYVKGWSLLHISDGIVVVFKLLSGATFSNFVSEKFLSSNRL